MTRGNQNRGKNGKQSLYFPEGMLEEIHAEAARQGRSLSWVIQQAWKIARSNIKRFPGANGEVHPQKEGPKKDEKRPLREVS